MRWPSVKFKKSAKSFIALGCISLSASAIDEKRLWLPSKHAKLFIDLKEAALAAEGLDRCVTVLSGTIDVDQSKPGHPIYRFLCRQENGRTYNEMVDGVSFETLTTKVVVPKEPTPEELEALRIAEEKRKQEEREKRISRLWELCEQGVKQKVRLMQEFTWVTDIPPNPLEVEDDSAKFEVDFDAKDIQGVVLRYRARCVFSSDDVLSLRVFARKSN